MKPEEEEWHILVPQEARDALGEKEVQRQSVIFEVFKAEKEYVADLEAMVDVGALFISRVVKFSRSSLAPWCSNDITINCDDCRS